MAIFEFKLPELGEGIHEGELVKWLVQPGDKIEEDQIIMEVQNDKAVVEVPSPVNGTVKELKVEVGTVSVVGDTLITIEVEGEIPAALLQGHGAHSEPDKAPEAKAESTPAGTAAAANDAQEAASSVQAASTVHQASTATAQGAVPAPNKEVLATPSVRKFAREQGVDLSLVKGTGRHGQVTRADVQAFTSGKTAPAAASAVASEAAVKAPGHAAVSSVSAAAEAGRDMTQLEERIPLKGIRKVIAGAMVKSMYTAPHVTLMDEVEVTKLVALRERSKPLAEKKGVKLTYLPFVVKALVAGLRQYPTLNASIDDEKGEIVYKHYYHIGIATDTDNGLMVPVVRDADRKNIWTIANEIRDLAARGREGKLAPNELKGSTTTITNIGSAGGMFFTPVINYPEVAILGTGRIFDKPIAKNGQVVIAPVMTLSLSFDHRLVDGATGQQFLNYVKQLLEEPELLVMEV